MTGPANLSPGLRNNTAVELHKMAFLIFEKLVDSGDGTTLETDQLRRIIQAHQIKTSCWLGHLAAGKIVDLLKGMIQEGWYKKKLEVLKDLQPDWFVPATLKDTGKTEEVVNAIEKDEGEASLLHDSFGLTEKKNSKEEPALNLDRIAKESKPISGRNSTTLVATKDTEYEEGQVDAGEATKNFGKNDKRSTSSQELVAQNQDSARLSRSQKLPHGPTSSNWISDQRKRGRATRPDQSQKRRRNTPSPERANQRRRTDNVGRSNEAHNRFGINTGGYYVKASKMISPTSEYKTIGSYRVPRQEMVHFFIWDVQQGILDDAHHCIVRALYHWAQRYGYGNLFCALLWYKAGHAELHEFHKVLRNVHINEAHLYLFRCSVQEFKNMLCRIAQIRHCAVHHEVDAPVLIIKEMVYDCIELTIMLRDRQATELMETIWNDTLEEISYNSNNRSPHEDLVDELRRTNKKIDKLTATYHALNRRKEDIYWELNGRHLR
ncbi:hypothetical protein BGAL_0135g00090 [Botrytis galanthina]|uniref:Uncharacterized protein n=1 Tax=Botrytis galanthina TaxID=278940 RepID=A0A4S8QZA7_9HELO|nr:hypothetical protein BGAL_0135g00090 [Botrytis galanthina]